MSTKTILVTRPRGDEKALTDLLHEYNFRVIHEPLTEIFLQHNARHKLLEALSYEPDAIILTSRHGAQSLALLTEWRDLFLLCVGEATAATALSLGFTRVETAGGTVEQLLDFIASAYDEDSRFLYISAKHVRVDIDKILTDKDMPTERIEVYEAIASEQLSDTLIEQLKRNQIDGVTFLSQRSASIFTKLLAKAEAQHCVKHLQAFCLSEAVAAPLSVWPWQAIHIADEPTLASIAQSVDNVMTT